MTRTTVRRKTTGVAGAGVAARCAVLFVLVPALLAGCATMSGGVSGAVSRSMAAVASAVSSASVVYEQNLAGRSTDAVTGTTLDDMLDDISTEQTAVAELDATAADEVGLRDEATANIRQTVDAIDQARVALALDPGARATALARQRAQDALERASADTTALSERLEQYR